MTAGLHTYYLDGYILILGAPGVIFFFIIWEIRVSKQKIPRWDGCSVASHLVLFYLPMSHEMTPGLHGLNTIIKAVKLSFLIKK